MKLKILRKHKQLSKSCWKRIAIDIKQTIKTWK